MKKCPFCAEEIRDEATKCRYCGSELQEATSKSQPQIRKCPFCAEEITIEAVKCRYCGSDLTDSTQRKESLLKPSTIEEKNPWLAAILNFLFQGIGYAYIGSGINTKLRDVGILYFVVNLFGWFLLIAVVTTLLKSSFFEIKQNLDLLLRFTFIWCLAFTLASGWVAYLFAKVVNQRRS